MLQRTAAPAGQGCMVEFRVQLRLCARARVTNSITPSSTYLASSSFSSTNLSCRSTIKLPSRSHGLLSMSVIDSARDTRVYVDYDVGAPPSRPGDEWVRFVLISDTHSQTTPIPDGDVLLHAGDLTTLGQPDDLNAQVEWLK